MDKFVVITPRIHREDAVQRESPALKLKQATMESLPNVVVLEQIAHFKALLESPMTADNQILTVLKELSVKNLSKQILLDTKIGFVVNKLRKHEHEKIKELAKTVFRKWKHCVENEERASPVIEVQCDKKTETMRKKAKSFLADSLRLSDTDRLPEQIERTVFLEFGRRIDYNYRRKIRSIVFELKHNESIRKKVVELKVSAEDLFRHPSAQA
mgnify:CR=1 FL=1